MYKISEAITARTTNHSIAKYFNTEDNSSVEEYVNSFANDPQLMKSVAISSHDFYSYIRTSRDSCTSAYLDAMLKYISRALTRATPYGSFSSVSVCKLGETTCNWNRLFAESKKDLCLPDYGWVYSIIAQLERDSRIFPFLKVVINPNLYERGNRLINPYVSDCGQNARDKRFQASINKTGVVTFVAKHASKPIVVSDLGRAISENYKSATTERTNNLLRSLVDSEFLLTEFRFVEFYCGEINALEMIEQILERIKRTSQVDDLCQDIKFAAATFRALNETQDVSKWLSIYEKLYSRIRTEDNNLLNVISFSGNENLVVGKTITNRVAKLERFLVSFAVPDNETVFLHQWKKSFVERFGNYSEVPFLELFDDNIGLGDPYRDSIRMLDKNIESRKYQYIKKLINKKITESMINQTYEIVITDDDLADIARLFGDNGLSYAPSFEIGVSIFANSLDDINNDSFTMQIIDNVGATQLGSHISRFISYMGASERQTLASAYEATQYTSNDNYHCVFVRDIPRNGRLNNIAPHNNKLDYSIDLGLYNGTNSLLLSDIMVGYDYGIDRLYLKSKSLGHFIKVTNDCMLNLASANHIARLFRDISNAYEVNPISSIQCLRHIESHFIPTIKYNNVIIQSATWTINRKMFNTDTISSFSKSFLAAKERIRFGRFIYIADQDRKLLIDTENAWWMSFLYRQLSKSGDDLYIQKCNAPFDESWVRDTRGNPYIAELIIPMQLSRKQSNLFRLNAFHGQRERVNENFVLFGEDNYVYVKLYMSLQYANTFLSEELLKFVDSTNIRQYIDKVWFIRYADPDFHIRLRIRAEKSDKFYPLFREVVDWVNSLVNKKAISKYSFSIYERETERYGGFEMMETVEQFFFADSQLVLTLLQLQRADSSIDDEVITASIVAMTFMRFFKPNDISKFLSLQPSSKKDKTLYRLKHKSIQNILISGKLGIENDALAALFEKRMQLCTQVREALPTECEINYIRQIMYSIAHMTCNRMNGDRLWENRVTMFSTKAVNTFIHTQLDENKGWKYESD